MRKSRFTEAQIIGMIKEQEAGMKRGTNGGQIKRFAGQVQPHVGGSVSLFAIDEAIDKIKYGTIAEYVYDPKWAALITC
jgi:hypothetical protein